MMSKPKIYAFSNCGGGDGSAVALAEDGTCVGGHWCSNEGWIPHDLGVTSDWHHEDYAKHYPDGFEVVFVAHEDIDGHAELNKALALNKEKSKAEKVPA